MISDVINWITNHHVNVQYLKEFGNLNPELQSLRLLGRFLVGVGKCGWQHVGKEVEEERQSELEERNDHEEREGDEPHEICGRPLKLVNR